MFWNFFITTLRLFLMFFSFFVLFVVLLFSGFSLFAFSTPLMFFLGFLFIISSFAFLIGYILNLRRNRGRRKLIDSSAFIDGRIIELAQKKVIEGPFVIPKFIINEMHRLADSSISQRRAKGRRALANMAEMQKIRDINIKIDKKDYKIKDVDTKLISLAKKRNALIITTDFNLSRVAEIESVEVINLNTLSSAVRKLLLPNEEVEIELVKRGDKEDQAVGYLEDGTMVVVMEGRAHIGKKVKISIVTTYPTQAGRIVFGKVKND